MRTSPLGSMRASSPEASTIVVNRLWTRAGPAIGAPGRRPFKNDAYAPVPATTGSEDEAGGLLEPANAADPKEKTPPSAANSQ